MEAFWQQLNPEQMAAKITEGFNTLIANAVGALSSTFSVTLTVVFSLIVSFYIILGKERLCRHTRKLIAAYCKPSWAEGLFRFSRMFTRSFTHFMAGQCTEAVILGVLMALAFTLFRLPYASLVGLLTAVCAMIPYIGAFTSLGVSLLLTLFVQPSLILR